MRHRYISYFAGIFLLAFFAVLNTGVFDFCQWISETSKTGGISA